MRKDPTRTGSTYCGTTRGRLRSFVVALLCTCGLGVMRSPANAGDGWWGDLDQGQHVQLTDVLRAPRSFAGRTLTFVCVFHKQESIFDAFRTRFSYRNFDNFSVWPDGAELWNPEPYKKDFPFLYLPKSHPSRAVLLGLEIFTRIEVTARIGAVSRGRPYLEVLSLRKTGHRLGRSFFRELNAGRNLLRRGSNEATRRAARKYRDMLITRRDLPKVYAAKVRRLYADALRELGDEHEAARVEQGGKLGDSWGGGGASWSDRPKPPSPADDRTGELDFGPTSELDDGAGPAADARTNDGPSEGLPSFPGASDAPGRDVPSFPDDAEDDDSEDSVADASSAPGFDAPGDELGMPPGLAPAPREHDERTNASREAPAWPDEEDALAREPPTVSRDEGSGDRRSNDRQSPNRRRMHTGPGPRGYGAFAMPRRPVSRAEPARNTERASPNRTRRSRTKVDKDGSNEWRMGSAKDLPAPGTTPIPGRETYPESRRPAPRAAPYNSAPPPGGIAPRRRTRIAGVK